MQTFGKKINAAIYICSTKYHLWIYLRNKQKSIIIIIAYPGHIAPADTQVISYGSHQDYTRISKDRVWGSVTEDTQSSPYGIRQKGIFSLPHFS